MALVAVVSACGGTDETAKVAIHDELIVDDRVAADAQATSTVALNGNAPVSSTMAIRRHVTEQVNGSATHSISYHTTLRDSQLELALGVPNYDESMTEANVEESLSLSVSVAGQVRTAESGVLEIALDDEQGTLTFVGTAQAGENAAQPLELKIAGSVTRHCYVMDPDFIGATDPSGQRGEPERVEDTSWSTAFCAAQK